MEEAPMPPGAKLAPTGSQTVEKPAGMSEDAFRREYLCEPPPAGFDWFCGVCLLGYYSPDVERSDADSNPLCRCGRILNGAHEQPPGLRWVDDDADDG